LDEGGRDGEANHCPSRRIKAKTAALFSSKKFLQIFSDFPSPQIFKRMHRVLNIDENKN